MNNIALGQYVDGKSIIHKLDPRIKIISLIILMVAVFLIPSPLKLENKYYPFIFLAGYTLIVLIIIILTKISLFKYLQSLKQLVFLLLFAFAIQILSPQPNSETFFNETLNFSLFNILIIITLLTLFILLRKILKAKLLIFIILLIFSIYLLTLNIGTPLFNANLKLYTNGLYTGAFFFLRVFLIIMLSTTLTLTTKPTDLTQGIEWLLNPLTFLKINVSIFAMIISLALRFIPTLFNETQKILKAQASRGVDFKEGTLKQQISQIISLLIPMFVISFKRAADLADAMEARGYIPGATRTKLNIMKFNFKDLISLILIIIILTITIILKVIYL